MNYDIDMPPYIQEMADWLDDDSKVHECNFANAYMGFEAMMGLLRSAAEGGQVAMPLEDGPAELDELAKVLSDKPVIPTTEETRKEYFG